MKIPKTIKYRVILLLAIWAIITAIYFIFFPGFAPLFLFIVIGSVAVVSLSATYTVMESIKYEKEREKEIRNLPKPKPKPKKALNQKKAIGTTAVVKKESQGIIEDYMDALPYVDKYVDSDKNYDEMPVIKDLIFALFSREELIQIDQLGLSKLDKLQFIRELLYYEPEERKNLIHSLLDNEDKKDEEIEYISPKKGIQLTESIRVYIVSLIEGDERRKLLVVDNTEEIRKVKAKVADLFEYDDLEKFLITSGGIILNPESHIYDYFIEDEDEIVLIPKRIE